MLLPRSSELVKKRCSSLTIAQTAQLPLILPTSTHGLRRRITAEFDRNNLMANVVAEIDSLSLLMSCVYDGMGATIKPMSALFLEGRRDKDWRALSISDARISRRNYLYTVDPKILSPAAILIAAEMQDTVRWLVETGEWPTVRLLR